jgi:predicted secreted protein
VKSILAGLLLLALSANAAETKPSGTLIDFHAQALRSAPNDQGNAMLYYEANGPQTAELARKVNQVIAAALATGKTQTAVKVKSGGNHTYPIYGKNSRTIEGWRMRSELLLESLDAAALSDLVGKLQATMVVGHLGFSPAPETLRRVDDEAAMDALATFQAKAARYAAALKKQYRIVSMNIGSNGVSPAPTPRYAMMKSAAFAAEAMPVEAGDSQIVVTVTGQIELLESAPNTKTP